MRDFYNGDSIVFYVKKIRNEVNSILILCDSVMGDELNNRVIKTELPLWTADANITHYDLIQSTYNEYICAGADIITTNTFRSTSWTYKRAGYTVKESKMQAKRSLNSAVKCSKNASKGITQIAGSIKTLDDCYNLESFPGRKIALDIYSQTLDWLINAGVDIILLETMENLGEIKVALSLSYDYQKSIWLSIIKKDSKKILDGAILVDILLLAKQYSVQTFLFDCNDFSKTILFMKDIHHFWDWMWGLYSNLGLEGYSNDYFNIINNDKFILVIENILKLNPDVIGFCFGSSPMHIKILKNQIIKDYQNAFENKT